jgi:hypothetical protein
MALSLEEPPFLYIYQDQFLSPYIRTVLLTYHLTVRTTFSLVLTPNFHLIPQLQTPCLLVIWLLSLHHFQNQPDPNWNTYHLKTLIFILFSCQEVMGLELMKVKVTGPHSFPELYLKSLKFALHISKQ